MRTHERCSIGGQTGAKNQDRSWKSEEKREAASVGREERRIRAVAEEQYVKRTWKRSV